MKSSAVYAFLSSLSSGLTFLAVYCKQWPLAYHGDPFYHKSFYTSTSPQILQLLIASASISLVTFTLLLADLRWNEGALRLAAFTSNLTSSCCGCAGIFFYMKAFMPVHWGPVIALVGVSFTLVIFVIMVFEGVVSLWQLTFQRKQPPMEIDEKCYY